MMGRFTGGPAEGRAKVTSEEPIERWVAPKRSPMPSSGCVRMRPPSPSATPLSQTAGKRCSSNAMKIQMDVDGTGVTATLDDHATSRDFISLLPLALTLEDYNGTEKISTFAEEVVNKGRRCWYQSDDRRHHLLLAMGNLAIFYKDFGYSSGLVKPGRIDSTPDTFDRPGTLRVTIQRMEE